MKNAGSQKGRFYSDPKRRQIRGRVRGKKKGSSGELLGAIQKLRSTTGKGSSGEPLGTIQKLKRTAELATKSAQDCWANLILGLGPRTTALRNSMRFQSQPSRKTTGASWLFGVVSIPRDIKTPRQRNQNDSEVTWRSTICVNYRRRLAGTLWGEPHAWLGATNSGPS